MRLNAAFFVGFTSFRKELVLFFALLNTLMQRV